MGWCSWPWTATRCTGAKKVKPLALAGLRRFQAMPRIARAFFGDPDLAYIAVA